MTGYDWAFAVVGYFLEILAVECNLENLSFLVKVGLAYKIIGQCLILVLAVWNYFTQDNPHQFLQHIFIVSQDTLLPISFFSVSKLLMLFCQLTVQPILYQLQDPIKLLQFLSTLGDHFYQFVTLLIPMHCRPMLLSYILHYLE